MKLDTKTKIKTDQLITEELERYLNSNDLFINEYILPNHASRLSSFEAYISHSEINRELYYKYTVEKENRMNQFVGKLKVLFLLSRTKKLDLIDYQIMLNQNIDQISKALRSQDFRNKTSNLSLMRVWIAGICNNMNIDTLQSFTIERTKEEILQNKYVYNNRELTANDLDIIYDYLKGNNLISSRNNVLLAFHRLVDGKINTKTKTV